MSSKRDQNIELSENDQINEKGHLLDKENSSNQSEILILNKKKLKIILLVLFISLLIGGAVAITLLFLFPQLKPNIPDNFFPSQWPDEVNKTEMEDVFYPSFIINSQENTLTQLYYSSIQNYESNDNGQNLSYTIINKAIYDIYTINSTQPPEMYKIIYSSLYTTVITLNSLCSKKSNEPENDDCQLNQILNLNKIEENESSEEKNIEDLIKSAILPICIVEHTDTNLIFSISCPETLSASFKDDILRAFLNIKPVSIKNFEFDKEYVDTKKEEKDDKIYINSFNNICLYPSIDPYIINLCNSTKNIITDKKGNLISAKYSNITKTINLENDYFLNNFTYEFKNIPKEDSESFDEVIYKKNLDTIFSLIGSIMKKEIYINNLTDFALDFMKDNSENETDIRNLNEEDLPTPGIHEENIFNKTLFNIPLNYFLKNDIGYGEGQSAKSNSYYEINKENYTDFSNYRIQSNLNDILNKFISLSNSANKLANKFNEDLNEPFMKMAEIANENIEKINSLIANKDLSEIFDSTLAIKELDSLPFSFIAATQNLYNALDNLGTNLLYIIDDEKKILTNDVSNFLTNSHNLIHKLFNNLTELSDALSSDKSKIVEIASFYLNDTDTSYYEILKKVKIILDNYYKDEKNLIEPLVNNLINKFYENAIKNLEKYISQLEQISDRLDNGDLIISLADTEGYKQAINNIFNSKSKVNEIIEAVKSKIKECIKLQPNGYFEPQNELDENKKSYGSISEKATQIAYILDNNELIDNTFDTIIIKFRNNFLDMLRFMENSLIQKFPLEENVLGTSSFNASFLEEVDKYLKDEKINILNFIKSENDNYLQSVNEVLFNFTGQDGKNLEQIMYELININTDLYFDNLNKIYNESLYFTFQNITNIYLKNIDLALQYFQEVQSKNSWHITSGFKNKYNTFYSSIIELDEYINKNLRNDLAIRYKNMISQIHSFLQSIKSNPVLEKYHKQLPLAEKHINYIKELLDIFNRHISDINYNTKFLPLINDYIENSKDYLNSQKNDFQNIYDDMAKKPSSNILQDYDKQRIVPGYRYCCKRFIGICVKHCWEPERIYYDPYNVGATNNILKLESINFNSYLQSFDIAYNKVYMSLNELISSYNSLLTNLDNEIELKKNFSERPELIYLNNIKDFYNSIIEEKFGKNLLIASYNYFKNKIHDILPNELSEIKKQWSDAYDQIYNDINSNKESFKSSIFEFFYLGNFYLQTYSQNISYGFGESIVEKLKNELTYTINYYYNLIESKLNQTYSFVLGNFPLNEKPFDDILNKRIEEINNSQNDILTELKNSKIEILNKYNQEIILQVNSKNFFNSNDIIKNHIKDCNTTINEKIKNLASIANQIHHDNPAELLAAKFYLENAINGRQVKEIYDTIDKVSFIDLQSDVFQNLIDDTWKIERDDFIKKIINIFIKLNDTNQNNFNYEFTKYYEILQNKLYEQFFTKDELINKINSFFSKGINNPNENSTKQINELLDTILNNVTNNIISESVRLSKELTSYSSDYKNIENRLNNYKIKIYEQFYSAITYAINDLYGQISEKFYNNFIEKGLSEYEQYLDDKNFGTAKFLNMTINLNEKINKDFKLFLNEYRNLTLNHIRFLYQKNIQQIDELFYFSDIELKINNTIDNIYNSTLLPKLIEVAIYNPSDEGVTNYDLSDEILNQIDYCLVEQISKAKNVMREMEGEEFNISYIPPADFSPGVNNIYDNIEIMFKNFSLTYISQERKEFDKFIGENTINNFKNLVNNFIPSFGVDFFDRILKFNGIQKINLLYRNLKYSLAETIIYYIGLAATQKDKLLPVDIKLKLFTLNNLDSLVVSKNNYILSNLNDRLDAYFKEARNYVVDKYLTEMVTSEELDLKLNNELKEIIKSLITENKLNYEGEYMNMMQEYVKIPFVEKYNKILNEATEDMKQFIEYSKIELKVELDEIFSLDSDSVLADIQSKLNNTINSASEYYKHFESFKISEEVIDYFENFGENIIVPKYMEIKELLDKKTIELIINNLERLSNEFKDEYYIENFKEEVTNVTKNFSSYFEAFNKVINSYGSIEDVYRENLEKEIAKNSGLRLLKEKLNDGDNIQNQIADVKLGKTFNQLKDSSLFIKEFILSLDLFVKFEDDIKKNINEKKKQYSSASYNLEKNKEQNNYYDLMIERLEELNQISSDYYSEVKTIYDIMKEDIINNIVEIDNLINKCEQVTYETINNKYMEIKEQFNKIEDSNYLEREEINIEDYNSQQTDNYITVKTKVENYLTNNKYTLDIIFDSEIKTPKIIGKMINIINPKIFEIDSYSTVGQYDKIGREINVIFNNISSYSYFVYDAGLNQANITTNFNFDEYSIKTQYYEEKTITVTKIIYGMEIEIPSHTIKIDIDTPDEEKFQLIPSKNKTYIENYAY